MDALENLYRAFFEYKKVTVLDQDVVRYKKLTSTPGGKKNEDVVVYFSTCTIEEDWVSAIEKGLPFVEKAIKEERQFIRNDGEVLPIEKVRKTSVTSIRDLAKHSNYITHEARESDPVDVMPDKMLMIQKESDFAVYENRVIYSLLVYLRDFVSMRLNKIKEETNKYEGKAFYNKTVDFGSRKIEYSFNIHEQRLNDPNFVKRNAVKTIIDRLDDILSIILVLLKTPLMCEVAKSDMVSRPITKTNVLKMNRNFRESLALFDYIAEYQGAGYTIQKMEKTLSPLKSDVLGDISEVVLLTSFITYMYGNGMETELQKAYAQYLVEEKRKEEDKILARLRSLHAKAKMEEKSINQYLLDFEEGYRIIEKRLENHDAEINSLKSDFKKQLNELSLSHTAEINRLNKEHEVALQVKENEYNDALKAKDEEHANKTKELVDSYETKLTEVSDKYTNYINEIKNDFAEEKANLISSHEEEISWLHSSYEEKINNITTSKDALYNELKESSETKINELETSNKELKKENSSFNKENKAYTAEIIALKTQLGRDNVQPNEFVSKASFVELEKDREAFLSFFDEAWKLAKKDLRKTHFALPKKDKEKK